MDLAEYETMRAVEDAHWWYGALRKRLKAQLEQASLPKPARILDAGCGTGGNLAMLTGFGECIALDYALPAAAMAHERATRARISLGSAEVMPLRDAACDAVLSADVWCHAGIRDVSRAAAECYRVLRPGGVLILNLPAYPKLLSQHDRAVANVRRFRQRETLALLKNVGFVVEDAHYWNSLLLPAAMASRLLPFRGHETESDLKASGNRFISTIASAVLETERHASRGLPLPCGLSILIRARKTS